jgi:hypothetical protein
LLKKSRSENCEIKADAKNKLKILREDQIVSNKSTILRSIFAEINRKVSALPKLSEQNSIQVSVPVQGQ